LNLRGNPIKVPLTDAADTAQDNTDRSICDYQQDLLSYLPGLIYLNNVKVSSLSSEDDEDSMSYSLNTCRDKPTVADCMLLYETCGNLIIKDLEDKVKNMIPSSSSDAAFFDNTNISHHDGNSSVTSALFDMLRRIADEYNEMTSEQRRKIARKSMNFLQLLTAMENDHVDGIINQRFLLVTSESSVDTKTTASATSAMMDAELEFSERLGDLAQNINHEWSIVELELSHIQKDGKDRFYNAVAQYASVMLIDTVDGEQKVSRESFDIGDAGGDNTIDDGSEVISSMSHALKYLKKHIERGMQLDSEGFLSFRTKIRDYVEYMYCRHRSRIREIARISITP